MIPMRFAFILFVLACFIKLAVLETDSCDADSTKCDGKTSDSVTVSQKKSKAGKKKFLLYDVNPGEGFNLRRDVYMRIASLVRKVRQETSDEWILVLPPWGPLYHWKSRDVGNQMKLPWAEFFDVQSLAKYVPVIEFHQFMYEYKGAVKSVYYLQHFKDMGASLHWKESLEESECIEEPPYKKKDNNEIHGWFWGYTIQAFNLKCISVQGTSKTLKPLLQKSKFNAIMIDRAEVILHDEFGNADYWTARRSMRFAKQLQEAGNQFRLKYLDSSDEKDNTMQNEDWKSQVHKERLAIGGPYIAVHLRRQDFVRSRSQQIPSIENAGYQIKRKLSQLNLTKVFISTDGTIADFEELKSFLPGAVRYLPNTETRKRFKDGGVAIVDQWICAHARFFIGSYESTFSFRIQEEREILGFRPSTTFNRFCGDKEMTCKQPTEWKIVYSKSEL